MKTVILFGYTWAIIGLVAGAYIGVGKFRYQRRVGYPHEYELIPVFSLAGLLIGATLGIVHGARRDGGD
jgi:hypothetical protein